MNYCNRKIWVCISIGTILVACFTLIILFIYHYQRRSRINQSHMNIKSIDQNFHKNLIKISDRHQQQIEKLLHLTPSIPLESVKLNEFNRITLPKTYIQS